MKNTALIKLKVLTHYLPLLTKGEMSFGRFIAFLRRLSFFFSKMQHNKFIGFNGGTRFGFYIPTYPSGAFFTATDKFRTFGEKLPCVNVLLSVTSACMHKCEYCYQRRDVGKDVELNLLIAAARKLQDMGVALFSIEGGEPFLRYDRLKALCDAIDDRSEIWVNSTGWGMTVEKLKELRIAAVTFSLHHPDPDDFNRFMGHDQAWSHLLQGIEMCHEAGVPVTFNTCLMREAFHDGTFEKVMDFAKEHGVLMIQLIKPKPAGGWLEREPLFSLDDLNVAKEKIHMYNTSKKYAAYPAICAQIIEEQPDVFGCTAGGTDRFYINAKGDVQPCEFLNISFGNIADEEFEVIYDRMRKCFETPGECILCEHSARKIAALYKQHNLNSLPLPPELSKQVYSGWDRGNATDLYVTVSGIGM
ncbi:MAG: radical SAM protein [Synergistaceae bacterium]|nr:radical SAM protein [Synergistaceae bacterium]